MTEQNTYPKISVIIPTYNRAALIGEAIDSVRDQTYTNWELIIVDDGSDDNTGEIIGQLKDNRILYVKAGHSGIGGQVKNKGMEKATGELIAFIDSDDLWDRTKLEKQATALQSYPDAGFCLTSGYNFKVKGEPIDFFCKQKEGIKYDDIFIDLFQSRVPGFTQALLFKKECLSKTGLFKEEKSFSDLDFIISLSSHFKAVILYEPLVFRRLHQSNYIHSTWEKSYGEGIEIIRSCKSKLPPAIYKNALFKTYVNYGEKCLVYKQRIRAVKKFLKAWQYKPFSIVPVKKMLKSVLQLK